MGKTKLTGKDTGDIPRKPPYTKMINIEDEACSRLDKYDAEECPYVPDMQEICEDIYDSLKAYCEYYDVSLLENCYACHLLDFINVIKDK